MEGDVLQAAQLLFQELTTIDGKPGPEAPLSIDFDLFLSLLEAKGWPEAQSEEQTLSQVQRFLLRDSPDMVQRFTAVYESVQRLGVLQHLDSLLLVFLRLAEDRRERSGRHTLRRAARGTGGGSGEFPRPGMSEWLRAADSDGRQARAGFPGPDATRPQQPRQTPPSAPQLARQSLRDILMSDLEPALARRVADPGGGLPGGADATDAPRSVAGARRPQYLDSYFPEHAIVSDLLLILQGLPGRNFVLVKSSASGMWEFAARGEASALPSHLAHCQRIADCGALLLRVQELLAGAASQRQGGSRASSRRRLTQSTPPSSSSSSSATRTGTLAALCGALEHELDVYKRRVADLEWYSVGGGMSSTFSFSGSASFDLGQQGPPSRLSLDDLLSIANLLRREIHSMCILADACLGHSSVRGVGILRVLYVFAQNGDPHLASMAGRLLCASVLPLVQHIRRWVLTGEVFDAHKEFFVRGAPEMIQDAHSSSSSAETSAGVSASRDAESIMRQSSSNYFTSFCLWVGPEACPYPLLTIEEAKLFFDAGRAAAFLHTGCQDYAFQVASDSDIAELDEISRDLSLAAAKLTDPILPCRTAFSRLAFLSSRMLRDASSRALELLFDKHHLMDHLDGILRCLLGRQGDFTLALLSAFSAAGVGPGMAPKTTGLYSLSANSLLDGAIAASNASLLPKYVQESLVIRLPGERPRSGGSGQRDAAMAQKVPWTSPELLDSAIPFTLSYNVDKPLDTVITPYSVSVYEKAFRMMYSLHCCGAALDRVEASIISFSKEAASANAGKPLRPGPASGGLMGALSNPAVARAARMLLRRASLVRARFQIMVRSVLTFACHEVIDKVYTPLLRLRPRELCGLQTREGADMGDLGERAGPETGLEELLLRHEDALLRLSYGLLLEGFVQKETRGYNYYAGAQGVSVESTQAMQSAQSAQSAQGPASQGAAAPGKAKAIIVENSSFTRFQLALRRLLALSLQLGEVVSDALQGLRTANTLEATATLEQGRRMLEALDSDLASEADEMAQCLERCVNLQVRGMDFQIFAALADDLRSCMGGRRLGADRE